MSQPRSHKIEDKKDSLELFKKFKVGLDFSKSLYFHKFEVIQELNNIVVTKTAP